MNKKRVIIGIVLVLLLIPILFSQFVVAEQGCCYGVSGCSMSEDFQCEQPGFVSQACEEVEFCDVVACCHGQLELQTSLYRVTCDQIGSPFYKISEFKTDTSSSESQAKQMCASELLPSCPYTFCGSVNPYACTCGDGESSSNSGWCCEADNGIFSSKAQCLQSPSCQSNIYYTISGYIYDTNNQIVPGATVTVGSKSTISLEDGSYAISEIVDGTQGTIIAAKGEALASVAFNISGKNLDEFNIILQLVEVKIGVGEALINCSNGFDDDNDQFGWNSDANDQDNAADICDSDCGIVNKTVYMQYYQPTTEFSCSDALDNDCDGLNDCEDDDCADASECQPTFCGDNSTQFPNSQQQWEVCDAVYDENDVKLAGDDSSCPGLCLPPGNSKQCTCDYSPACGNGVIDPPQEQCDGIYNPFSDSWEGFDFISLDSLECNQLNCGTPNSAYPCVCKIATCGDGEIQSPEECDPGKLGVNPDPSNCEGCSPNCLCPQQDYTCGNGVLEPTEDCEGLYDEDTGEWINFETRRYGCLPEYCGWPGIEADTFLADENNLDTLYIDESTVTFPGQCLCPPVCQLDPPQPEIKNITTEKFMREFNILWDDDCSETAVHYDVLRCKSESGIPCDPTWDTWQSLTPNHLSKGTFEFTDDSFDSNELYCYKVRAVHSTLTADTSEKDSEMVCIESGDEVCYTLKDKKGASATEFCWDPQNVNIDMRTTCDDDNSIMPVQDINLVDCKNPPIPESFTGEKPKYICVGFYNTGKENDGTTACIQQSLCDQCSDPFGLFSWSHGIFGTASFQGVNSFCDQIPSCYSDSTKSVVDKFNSLDSIYDFSCYDYHSENACGNDKKGLGNCEWVWSQRYEEFGIGVCRTNIIEEQQCDRCHQHSNKVFGKCDYDMCGLYGECYYNKAENGLELYYKSEYDLKRADATYGSDSNSESVHGFKKCIHKSETSCLEFDRKEDCVNSSSPYSLQAEEQVGDFGFDFNQSNFLENIYYKEPVINVNHGFVLNTLGFKTPAIVSDSFKKLEGDNIPLAQSDDYFGFGKCQWHPVGAITLYSNGSTVKNTQGMCGKNSDNDPNMISAQTPPFDQYVEDLESMDFNTTNLDESNYTFYQVNQFIPDCGSNAVVSLNNYIVDSLKCRQDFTEPNTTIMNLEKIKGEFEIEVLIQDNSFDYSVFQPQIQQSSEGLEDDEITVPIPQINFMFNPYPKTYVCITDLVPTNADEDNFCYPNGTAKRITLNKNLITYENVGHKVLYNFSEKGFKSGMHRFHYFTEDISHNLEPVRTFDVLIDADAPNITFTSSNYSFEIFEDEWRTNLSLTMKSMNEPAICTANLTLNGYTVYPVEAVYDEYGEEWDLNFGYMIDNTYVFVYTCEDEVGNIAKGNLTIFIDGDQSITQPQPKGTINDSQVELKVYTGKSAECRFLENPDPNHDDLPGFEWNATANMNAQQKQEHIANLFPSMTPFETSVGDEPNTIHKHKLTLDPKSDSRFHQFYVKCLMGEKYRGNAGDEIRFALDLTAPTTITHEDVDVFQGWYNADLTVELECMDWPMYGVGFSWEYGCSADENTFFCLGENCDEYQNYLAYKTNGPIFLTEEGDNYISYFSMDKGNNKEVVVQNALFKLDKTPSNLTLEFWEGNIKEDILRPGIPYTIFLNSSKPLISPGIQLPKITYSSDPQNFVGTIELFPTNVTTIYTGFFHIPYINDNLDFEGDGKFVVSAKDFHNVPVEVEFSIPIDTKPPTQPVIEPEFEQYPEWDYPLRVHDGIYYTSEPTFHITGYTDELLDIIAVLNYQDGSSNGANNKNYTFTQSEDSATKMFYDDSIISAFGDYFEVRVNGDISDLTSSAHFVGFDSETETIGPRTEYGDYGKFYDMVSVDYMGGDNKYTEVMVYPALEESYPLNNEVFFYTREYPLFWYGFDLELKPYQLNQFYLKAYDPSGNLVRLPTTSDEPSVFSVFLDPDKPIVHEHFPMDGTTAQDSFDIQIYVTEDNSESGIDNESIVFSISGGNFLDETVPAQVERSFDLENSSDHPQFNGKKVYRIFYSVYDLEEATYEVEIYAEDLAGNILDENIASASWTFMVDKSAPIYPNFELVPGFPGLTISENSTPRWYSSQNNPEFSLEFFDDDPITITSVSLLSTPFSDNANCTESEDIFNFFNCKFFNNDVTDMNQTSQDYALNIEAFKTLADGTDSPRGIYGPFEFTIDSQAPDFEILNFKPRIRDDFNFTMNFDVDNEVHPLQVSITLTNANGETKEFDQYVTLPSSTGFYSFDWPVNIDWPDGNYSFSLTLKDFAGNYNTYNDYIYLDTTYPAFSIDLINVSNAFKIDNEWYTANSNVTITGTTDSDTYYIWVSPGDWNESTQAFAEKKAAVITKTNGVPSGFHVSVLLSGKLKEEVPNKFTIGVIDQAGNPNIKDFNIVQDLLEPATPSFYIST